MPPDESYYNVYISRAEYNALQSYRAALSKVRECERQLSEAKEELDIATRNLMEAP